VSCTDRIFDRIIRNRLKRKNLIRLAAFSGLATLATVSVYHYVTVKPGDSLSEIAQKACGNAGDWTGIYQQNNALIGSNPNLIFPGQHLKFKCDAAAIRTILSASTTNNGASSTSHGGAAYVAPAATYSGGSGFQACVIARESGGNSQVMNSTGHYGLYQFSSSTWAEGGGNPADFGHASIAEQNQVYYNIMANSATTGGAENWAPYDGC